jgi:hypothetical protein
MNTHIYDILQPFSLKDIGAKKPAYKQSKNVFGGTMLIGLENQVLFWLNVGPAKEFARISLTAPTPAHLDEYVRGSLSTFQLACQRRTDLETIYAAEMAKIYSSASLLITSMVYN